MKSGGGLVRELLSGFQSLLLPAACLTCRTPMELQGTRSDPLCPACFKALPRSLPPWCRICGVSLAGQGAGVDRCLGCSRQTHAFDQAISPFPYEGSAKELILALKYQSRLSVAPFLGRLLAQTVRERLGSDPADAIVPVPLHPTRLRERTFNQALVLAQEVGRHLHLPCWNRLLTRVSPTCPQAELSRDQRRANVRAAFQVKTDPFLRLARILLVDDVLTTGATADACARLLKEAGTSRVIVVTVSRD